MNKNNMVTSSQSHWIPLSDMMTGLMSVFLVIALMCIAELQERARVALAVTQDQAGAKDNLSNDLNKRFGKESSQFGAEYIGNLDFRFPGKTFYTGSAELSEEFKANLKIFFPKYISTLIHSSYKDYIEEIRIEGFTSPQWAGAKNDLEAYIKNMELSQARTRTTLEFLLDMNDPMVKNNFNWLKERLTANGLSSSHPIKIMDKIDNTSSQRVEFHLYMTSNLKLVRCKLEKDLLKNDPDCKGIGE